MNLLPFVDAKVSYCGRKSHSRNLLGSTLLYTPIRICLCDRFVFPCKKEVNFLKIIGILNNVFRPQKPLRKQQ